MWRSTVFSALMVWGAAPAFWRSVVYASARFESTARSEPLKKGSRCTRTIPSQRSRALGLRPGVIFASHFLAEVREGDLRFLDDPEVLAAGNLALIGSEGLLGGLLVLADLLTASDSIRVVEVDPPFSLPLI